MTIDPFGEIGFDKRAKEWFGRVDNICPNNKVELSISAETQDEDLSHKLESVRQFAEDYDTIVQELYNLAYRKYKDTEFEVTRSEIEQMYFLTGVNLKSDSETWWLVLEPNFSVDSIYNHFLRFTMVDRRVIWKNFDIAATIPNKK
jgi:hypothetical protein